ncbi:MAG: flippase [Candidatus Omnitrophica bacterium]|nr:flippase [Candidatus Omnitrophota bacterium]MBU1923468.1 flippase [Candidatus Omnitrophota bacterium]
MVARIVTHKERKIVLANFISLTTLQGVNYLLPLVVLPYLIRVIGIEKFGLIAFAQSLVQYFMILTDYGFSLSATRKISLCKDCQTQTSAIFSSVMTVKLLLAGLSFLILCMIMYFVPRFRNDWLVYILSFGAVVGNTLFPVWFFQGKEKMSYITLINVIGGITYAICIFIFIKGPKDYLLLPILNSLLFIIGGIFGLYIAFSKFKLEFIFQKYTDIKNELKTGWDIFISTVSINAYTTTRIFAVGLFTNNTITGYFSLAERIANFIQTFPMDSFSRAVFPRISKVFARNKKRALAIMQRIQFGITSGFIVSLPITYFIAPWIIRFACGSAHQEAVATLRLLLVAVFFVGANAFRVQFLLVAGKPDFYAKIHVAAAIIGSPLIFLLIQKFSYLGAALATVLTEAGVFTITWITIKKLAKEISQ